MYIFFFLTRFSFRPGDDDDDEIHQLMPDGWFEGLTFAYLSILELCGVVGDGKDDLSMLG